ncbi:hypothetical protein SAMN05216551_10410 [Chitinasiproducens palmae]|uniref:Uncharacterized protein n=1 Tax=Chitinasiproducens palmae TaxID=1770053 RepID=A0A1H2PMZ0_9BURK|nr:hypothetical protein SAMN05216551_10410 [Chitinasiproducens palmae]
MRCKPGDLALIKNAWNKALVGRLVVIGSAHSATEWNVTLVGEPGLTLTKNRRRLTAARRMLAYDAALEPIDLPMPCDIEITLEDAAGLRRRSLQADGEQTEEASRWQ